MHLEELTHQEAADIPLGAIFVTVNFEMRGMDLRQEGEEIAVVERGLPSGMITAGMLERSNKERSASGDRNWDRHSGEDRDRDRDRDQDPIRRDEEYRRPWEDKDREYRRDPPFRPDSRNSSGTNPSTPHSATGPMSNQLSVDRTNHAYRGPSSDSSRRSSGPNIASIYGGNVKDPVRVDVPSHRADRDRIPLQPPSPPPQAPQVPAFGSISYPPPTIERGTVVSKKPRTTDTSESIVQTGQGPSRQPPSAPKAQLLSQAPSAPKAEQHVDRLPATDAKTSINRIPNVDRQPSITTPAPPTAPGGLRLSIGDIDSRSRPVQVSPDPRQATEDFYPRAAGQLPGSQVAARPTSLQLVHPSRRETVAESMRRDTTAPFPSRQSHREISIPGQSSPAKVPTGPRADRSAPSIRQAAPPSTRVPPIRHANPSWRGGPPNLTWVRPGLAQGPPQHAPRGPSIMNTVPTKRDNAGDEKVKSPFPEPEDRDGLDAGWPRSDSSLKAALDQAKAESDNLDPLFKEPMSKSRTESPRTGEQGLSRKQSIAQDPALETLHVIGAEAGTEDGVMDLDDDDFEAAEQKFNRELHVLEAKRPPTPRHHPELLALLEECDALASAAEDLDNGVLPEAPTESALTQAPISGLPSPKAENLENMGIDVNDDFEFSRSVVRKFTPPVESLPFLASGPPTPFSQIDDLQETDLHEIMRSHILDRLANQDEEMEVHGEQSRRQFSDMYRSWRWKNLELEELEKARNDAAPPPAPVEIAPTIGCAITSISGTRRVRNTSESQMEEILKISEQTAADEEMRRTHQLADRGPNYEKEAVVPDMLTSQESKASLFTDMNNFVPDSRVLEALAFVPRKDSFTAEEHDRFVDQYILNPKRWGAIAETIPGRNYQDCVQHYYLTKGTCMYKEKEKAFLRIKKGRRGPRGPQNRAKSTNLMPTYDGNTELDPASTAVTETGRPKRTAAPVFGATSDVEGATPAATPLRRNVTSSKVDVNGEVSAEKPRRRGTAAPKDKGARRGKAVLLAAAPGPSPSKAEREPTRGKSREPKVEVELGLEELESGNFLSGLQSSQVPPVPMNQSLSIENWMNRQPVAMNTNLAGAPKSQQQMFEAQVPAQQQRSGQPTTSSYWSVPEHQDFHNLLGYFGTNWQAIADTMKTKSVTMVRNYYNRAAQKEENDFLKKLAQDADERIKRGEDMGPPPAPSVQNKRKSDNAAPLPPQRPLAPSVDQTDAESESSQVQPSKATQASPPQPQPSQPRYPNIAQAESPAPAFSQPPTQVPGSTGPRTQQQPSQRVTSLQGPRSGFFSDERARPLLQAQTPSELQKPRQQQRQIQPEEEVNRIRRHEAQNRVEALKEQQKQDFLDQLGQQHRGRHLEQAQTTTPPQSSIRSQPIAASQPFLAPSRPTSSQVRIAPSQPPELESRPRVSSQTQIPPSERQQQDPSMNVRRPDPGVPARGRDSALQSPASARIPSAIPLDVIDRPSPIPPVPTPAPPRPSPAPAKRSNIMSILNDEPSEPPVPWKRAEDAPPAVPLLNQISPTTLTPQYRPPSQLAQRHSAREPGTDRPVLSFTQQHRPSLSQSITQQQQQQQQQIQPQQAGQARESPNNWAAAAQRLEQQRSNYPTASMNSPHAQPAHIQQASRGPFQSIQRSHAPSPPPPPFSHSRTSSYAGGSTQHAGQSQMPSHHGQQQAAAAPTHAVPNLQPSPYATIQPHQPMQGPPQNAMQLHQQQRRAQQQQEHIQRQQNEQRNIEMQQQARQQEALQYQQQRSFEAPRRQPEPPTFLRPKESGPIETDRSHERLMQYQNNLMRQEQERKMEQTRREQGRVYTPPVYPTHVYGPPTSQQQQQSSQGHGRYEERR
ncbi:MAG: hypothetical protein L6R40_004005 [Gallowayella cf. fulva]|nr:MAG: hypothetical protein L6R40_004005 [Xanthomendoza cf. fulva]